MRGEEGAISAPPRVAEIVKEIDCTGLTGWDGLFWKKQYESFGQFMQKKNLYPYFGSVDSLTRAMGDVSFDHQGRRIQGMRMQNLGMPMQSTVGRRCLMTIIPVWWTSIGTRKAILLR